MSPSSRYAVLISTSFILGACSTTRDFNQYPALPSNVPVPSTPAISNPVMTPTTNTSVNPVRMPGIVATPGYSSMSMAVASASVGYAPSFPVDYQARTFSDAIAPQDTLEINVYKVPELSKTMQVDSAGNITMPLIGTVRARGLSPSALESEIAARLSRDFMNNPQVSVLVKSSTQNRITVDGAVKNPGVFPATSDLSLLQAVALGGGTVQTDGLHHVMLYRRSGNGMQQQRVDLDAVRAGVAPDIPLQQDDRVVVLEAPTNQRVTVEGEVGAPGVFPIKGHMTILQALALAGGATRLANNDSAILMRYLPNGQTQRYQVNLTEIRTGRAPDPELAADDRLVVLPSEQKVFIENAKTFISPLKLIP